ncbi:MAG: carbamoyltransferase [Verrucomicrobiota bacterium]
MKIIGLSAYYHDSAAALLIDGKIMAAAQEERFSRIKHDAAFPNHALSFCLKHASLTLDDIDFITFYDKPFLKFERLLETYATLAPQGYASFRLAMPLWVKEKLFLKSELTRQLGPHGNRPAEEVRARLRFNEHHLSHAASAFYPSPFEQAAILTLDGVGEWATSSISIGRQNSIEKLKEIHFPHSLGLLYSAFTYFTGFKVNSGEYKLMGLAPYGRPVYADTIRNHLIDIKADGSFRLNLRYFDFATGLTMTNQRFESLLDVPLRTPETRLNQQHMDLAASIQVVTEEILLKTARYIRKSTGMRHLCLAGGVALNCVANGKLLKEKIFDQLWIQPASGDAGGAVGAALTTHYHSQPGSRKLSSPDSMYGSYLGPSFTDTEIRNRLTAAGAVIREKTTDALLQHTATRLADGDAVGWFQGRMEFGPRALGGRSILGDPRSPSMQSTLNLKIKFRESFRPFAPSVLAEHVSDFFDVDPETVSPYMLLVAEIPVSRRKTMTAAEAALAGIEKLNIPRSDIPAVTHIDYSARIQTVHQETNPLYHRLLSLFHQQTGTPVLVNTSFNVRGEPIVCTPEDAFRCFMGTRMDGLAIGNFYLEKSAQDPALLSRYEEQFELD